MASLGDSSTPEVEEQGQMMSEERKRLEEDISQFMSDCIVASKGDIVSLYTWKGVIAQGKSSFTAWCISDSAEDARCTILLELAQYIAAREKASLLLARWDKLHRDEEHYTGEFSTIYKRLFSFVAPIHIKGDVSHITREDVEKVLEEEPSSVQRFCFNHAQIM